MTDKNTETKALTPIVEVRHTMEKMAPQFKAALPANVTPEKFIRVTMTAIQNMPKLLQCERQSLYSAAMRCAADGLLPDGREAALIPFGDTAQYLPMIGGICKKARNSGEIGTIDAQVVHENDEYEAWTDEKGPHFKHKRARKDRGEPILAYAYAVSKDGFLFFEEMSAEEIGAVEKVSRAKNDSPWKGPFRSEMWRKTVLHRLGKYRLPSSADLDDVLRADAELYDLKDEPAPQPAEPKTKPSRVSKIIEAQAETARPAAENGHADDDSIPI